MSDFNFDFVSDTKKNYLLVEVYFKKQRLFQINKEQGSENLEIEFLSDIYVSHKEVKMIFPLSDFDEVLREAKESLLSCK